MGKIRKGYLKMYIDENDFRKKKRSLKKYCIKAYKYLTFHTLKGESINGDGHYIDDLPASNEFVFMYGQPRIHYSVKDGVMILEDLEPQQFLLDGYMRELQQYKGMFYRNEKDKKKIDFYKKFKEVS